MDKENKKLDIKTFKFSDFQNKIDEGVDRVVGFKTFEGEDTIDDLGEGEVIDTDVIEEAPVSEPVEEAPDTVEGNADTIDTGDTEVRFETLGADEQKKLITDKLQEVRAIAGKIGSLELNKLYKYLDDYIQKYNDDEK
jgi:hypothetical protein